MIWGANANAKDKADPIRIEKAFPAIISKAKSQRVNRLMRSRAPKIAHPRRVGSTYLLSGLVECHKCNRALSGQDAKSGQFSYYVCQSIMKRGKDACETPRLNARRFEEMVVGKIRSNVLTEGNIRALVKVVDEQMDGVAREQRKRLETIEDELEDVKRKLGRIWHFVETTDIDMADASDRIKEHRERQERLEDAAADAMAILSQRRAVLDGVNTIAAYAQDMSEFLNESELTERRAFIETFVKEIVVMHPRRVGSTYLLSGLVECHKCNRAAQRPGRQERSVLLLRLPVDHEARQGRLRDPQAQRPALRGDGRRQDSLQRPHRGQHPRPGEGRRRADGRSGPRAAQEAGDH